MMHLTLEDLGVTIGGHRLVDGLDLDVPTGQVVGLVGPNGSGKSTALRCIYRALRPSHGVVRIDGAELQRLSLRETARRIAAVTQDNTADVDFTVSEVVALGRTPHRTGRTPLTSSELSLCREAMAQMDVLDLADRGILSLSGGERQRVGIARALVQQPEVLVLDEPTNHLDIRHQIELLGHLRHCGLTVLVVLHDLNLAAATCDRLAVLNHGRLVATGTVEEVVTSDLLHEVFGVRAAVVRHPLTSRPQVLFHLGSPHAVPTEAVPHDPEGTHDHAPSTTPPPRHRDVPQLSTDPRRLRRPGRPVRP